MPPERRDEIMRQALDARARQTGVTDRKALAAPWMGFAIGREMANEPDISTLWDTVYAINVRYHAMARARGLPLIHGKIACLPVKPNEESAIERPDYDLRTDEEKTRDAIAAWERLEATLRAVDPCLPLSTAAPAPGPAPARPARPS